MFKGKIYIKKIIYLSTIITSINSMKFLQHPKEMKFGNKDILTNIGTLEEIAKNNLEWFLSKDFKDLLSYINFQCQKEFIKKGPLLDKIENWKTKMDLKIYIRRLEKFFLEFNALNTSYKKTHQEIIERQIAHLDPTIEEFSYNLNKQMINVQEQNLIHIYNIEASNLICIEKNIQKCENKLSNYHIFHNLSTTEKEEFWQFNQKIDAFKAGLSQLTLQTQRDLPYIQSLNYKFTTPQKV